MALNNIEIDSELLISLVEERPVLWDRSLDEYKDKIKTQNAWKEVCSILRNDFDILTDKEKNEIGKCIVKRWTNLRDSWMKWNKKIGTQKVSGSGAKTLRKYVFHDQMMFLKKISAHRESVSSVVTSQCESEANAFDSTSSTATSSDNIAIDVPPVPKKKKKADDVEVKILRLLENESEQNRHLSFIQGVLPTLNSFTEEQTLDFQMGVLQLIKNITNKSGLPVLQPHTSNSVPIRSTSTYEQSQNVMNQTSLQQFSTDIYPRNTQTYTTYTPLTSYTQCSSRNTSVSAPSPTPPNILCNHPSSQQCTQFNAHSPSSTSSSVYSEHIMNDLDFSA